MWEADSRMGLIGKYMMQNRSSQSRVPAFVVIIALAATVGACAKTEATTPPTQAPTDASASSPDYNFECAVNEAQLQPWPATGMDVPAQLQAKFEFWMAMDTSTVPTPLQDSCENPPSGGDYSPVQGPDLGSVSRADIVVANQSVTIYRAYTAAPFDCAVKSPAGELGSWWSLTKPDLPKQGYRESVDICPAWNDLSMITTCTLAAGTVVLVGPTQSISCEGTSTCDPAPAGWDAAMPATTAAQLYISTYSGSTKRSEAELGKFLLDCETAAWAG
jgi:hypothetical protein